ncbi:MAG: hypothetical protein ACXQS8_06230, partial [Candidatus Helarchaeales archaeon]
MKPARTAMITILILGSFFIMATSLALNVATFIPVSQAGSVNLFQPVEQPFSAKDASPPTFSNWYFNNDPFNLTNVSQGLNVSIGTPVMINVTIQDNEGVQNATLYYWTSITENAGPDHIIMRNYTYVITNVTDNSTITSTTLYGLNFINNLTSVNSSDDVYYGCSNDGSGILTPLSVNLTDIISGNYETDDYVKITIEGHVNTTQGVSIAGTYLYNWTSSQLDEISNSSLNSTSDVTSTIIISGNNITNYINNANEGRLEVFFNVTGTNNVQLLIDQVTFEIHKDPSSNFYAIIPGLPWEREGDHKGGRENITFWVEAYDSSGSLNSTQSWGYNYTNIDVEAPLYEVSLADGDFVSGIVPIQITAIDSGSGIKNITLEIDKGTPYEENKTWGLGDFESIDPTYKNVTVIYNWNVTGFLNYNGTEGTNATHVLNISIFDRDGFENSFNSTGNITVYVDNTDPETPYLNVRTSDLYDLTLNDYSDFSITNQTQTNLTLAGMNFINTTAATYHDDDFYHECSNDSRGILVPYAIDLDDFNLTKLENLNYLNITVSARINVSDGNVLRAGLQLYNWTSHSLYDVNVSAFNSTSKINCTFQITRTSMWDFINESSNMRLEMFVNITSNVNISVQVYYIEIVMERFKTHEIYCDNLIESNMSIAVKGFDEIYYEKMVLEVNDQSMFTWTLDNSTNNTFSYKYLNSSDLPSGTLLLNLTVYDKAGNTNSSTMTIVNDNDGPDLKFISHLNNSVINKNGTWNAVEKLIMHVKDAISSIQNVSLYIDDSILPVYDGQQGQIIEYNATGDIVYVQTNSTWRGQDFEDYIYFYWNISALPAGGMHNLTIVGYDSLGNVNQTTIFVNISNYIIDIDVQYQAQQSVYYGDRPFLLTFIITNTGNSTILNLQITPTVPSGYRAIVQVSNEYLLDSLAPGESITIYVFIFPKNVLFLESAQVSL